MPQEQKERDEAVRIARQKALIRVAAESAMVEIIRTDASVKEAKEGTPGLEWLYAVVKDLVSNAAVHCPVDASSQCLRCTTARE
jgi:regulator of nonsense transcripts 2